MSPWKSFELGYWLETTALNNFSPQRLRRVHTSAALVWNEYKCSLELRAAVDIESVASVKKVGPVLAPGPSRD